MVAARVETLRKRVCASQWSILKYRPVGEANSVNLLFEYKSDLGRSCTFSRFVGISLLFKDSIYIKSIVDTIEIYSRKSDHLFVNPSPMLSSHCAQIIARVSLFSRKVSLARIDLLAQQHAPSQSLPLTKNRAAILITWCYQRGERRSRLNFQLSFPT